ncbi:hypothetical protein, partial [Mesorhizobium sp.]|uniref:hypothetical protein n=1 Tax=Mesorhizobium sp. TaxID=1871066 RepID=UPI00257C4A8A
KPPVPGRVPELAAAAPTRQFSMPTIREYSSPDDTRTVSSSWDKSAGCLMGRAATGVEGA